MAPAGERCPAICELLVPRASDAQLHRRRVTFLWIWQNGQLVPRHRRVRSDLDLGAVVVMPPPDTTLADIWERCAQKHATRTCLIVGGTSFSYESLDALANKFARWATSLRYRDGPLLRAGDTAALLMANGAEAVVAMLGLAKAGVGVAWLRRTVGRSATPYVAGARGLRAKLVLVDSDSVALLTGDGDAEHMCEDYRTDAGDGPRLWYLPAGLAVAARGALGRRARGGRAPVPALRRSRGGGGGGGGGSGPAAPGDIFAGLPQTHAARALLHTLDVEALGGAGAIAPPGPARASRAGIGLRDACMYVFKEQAHSWHPTALAVTADAFWALGSGLAAGAQLAPTDVLSNCGMPLSHPVVGAWGLALLMQSGAALSLAPDNRGGGGGGGGGGGVAAFWDEARRQQITVLLYAKTEGEPSIDPVRRLLDEPAAWGVMPTSGAERERTHRVRLALGSGLQRGDDVRALDAFQQRFGVPTLLEVHGASGNDPDLASIEHLLDAREFGSRVSQYDTKSHEATNVTVWPRGSCFA